jgi:hypothetical protein
MDQDKGKYIYHNQAKYNHAESHEESIIYHVSREPLLNAIVPDHLPHLLHNIVHHDPESEVVCLVVINVLRIERVWISFSFSLDEPVRER